VDTFVDLSVTPYRKVAVVIKELAIDILINTMVSTLLSATKTHSFR